MTQHGNDGNDGNAGNERERRDNGDPIETLRSELKRVSLAPEFAARLRQRIDEAPGTRGAAWLTGWRWLVPVAAVAGIVVVIVSVSLRRPNGVPPVVATGPAPAAATAPVTGASSAVGRTAPSEGVAPGPPASVNADLRVPKPGRRVSTATGDGAPAVEPAPEVLTNQPALYRALWARAGKGPSAVEVTTTVLPDASPNITVPPVEVNPIAVKWLGDPLLAPAVPPIVR